MATMIATTAASRSWRPRGVPTPMGVRIGSPRLKLPKGTTSRFKMFACRAGVCAASHAFGRSSRSLRCRCSQSARTPNAPPVGVRYCDATDGPGFRPPPRGRGPLRQT